MGKTKLRVKLRRPETTYTVMVECDYETTPLGEIKGLAVRQIIDTSIGLDLMEITPIEDKA